MASQALREQDEEAKAALAMAERVPVPRGAKGNLLAGGSAGAEEWLGGPHPEGPGGVAQGFERLPLSPDKHSPAPVTPEEMYKGVKVEPEA